LINSEAFTVLISREPAARNMSSQLSAMGLLQAFTKVARRR
jgi:hypothetical protein